MPKLTSGLPKYRKHRASGQAIVTLSGKDFYLGPWKTKASRDEYDRLVGEWQANGRRLIGGAHGPSDLTVTELIVAYWHHAELYYRTPDGTQTREVPKIRLALKHLRKLYGATNAADFGPVELACVREAMIAEG